MEAQAQPQAAQGRLEQEVPWLLPSHCCQSAASLLPDPWACGQEWHNYLIPVQGDLGHTQTDGGPGDSELISSGGAKAAGLGEVR